ncbi:MAG: hypothetical protein L0211_04895, partial [Planctomycetaceae bacterium]|nr:hypothetical protein [Planctomycetaceae bacterium]
MSQRKPSCPVCDGDSLELDRRYFLTVAGAAAGAALLPGSLSAAEPANRPAPETLVKKLYETLTDEQKKLVAFEWDHVDSGRNFGLLRTRISNNWHITQPQIRGDFYTKDQQEIVRRIYEGLFQPEWV